MNAKRSLTAGELTLSKMLFVLVNLIGLGVTVYLTSHFYDVHYPTGGLGMGSSGCNINSFFNCDAATFSSISQIAGIPLSIFGLAVQLIFLISALVGSEDFDKTCKSISLINAIGCLILFVYSLVVLGSLCPYCTLYYIVSWITFYLFWKKSDFNFFNVDMTYSGISLLVLILCATIAWFQIKSKKTTQASLTGRVISAYEKLPQLETAQYLSPFTLSGDNAEAKVTIMKFSDFQCPFCKVTSELLEQIAQRYKNKVNIRYYFYPLDSNCNSQMERQLHPFACAAAKVAACDKKTFKQVHDRIFHNQQKIDSKFLNNLKSEYQLKDCDTKTAEALQDSMNQARLYNVASTPTLILNGRKIEKALPLIQWYSLIDHLLKK